MQNFLEHHSQTWKNQKLKISSKFSKNEVIALIKIIFGEIFETFFQKSYHDTLST